MYTPVEKQKRVFRVVLQTRWLGPERIGVQLNYFKKKITLNKLKLPQRREARAVQGRVGIGGAAQTG